MRVITPETAIRDLNARGVSNMQWDAVVVGGLFGWAIVSRIVRKDGLVWEWEDRGDQVVRVYLYTEEELADNEVYRRHV